MYSSYKMATASLLASKSPIIISLVSHPNWTHKGKGLLGNVAEPKEIYPFTHPPQEVFYNFISHFGE